MLEAPITKEPRRAIGRAGARQGQHAAMLQNFAVVMALKLRRRLVEGKQQVALLERAVNLRDRRGQALAHRRRSNEAAFSHHLMHAETPDQKG